MKIIDVSCPRQLLAVIEWIVEGNRGLVYLRIMRNSSPVLYEKQFKFEYGKGYILREKGDMVLVSSGHGVHECLSAAEELEARGMMVSVLDMPSFDAEILIDLLNRNKKIIIAEQNNGYILQRLLHEVHYRKVKSDISNIYSINTRDKSGKAEFIHSGTYKEIIMERGLDAAHLADLCSGLMGISQ